ncbi:MAG: hypothetical protein EXR79_15660, partial [Myxococcales bacterium]|nr:hypothetical protein [Myxococcales bacterium]
MKPAFDVLPMLVEIEGHDLDIVTEESTRVEWLVCIGLRRDDPAPGIGKLAQDGTLKPGNPALAALLQGALFGPHELQRVEPTGKAGAPPLTTKSRNCVDSQGFNLHAN